MSEAHVVDSPVRLKSDGSIMIVVAVGDGEVTCRYVTEDGEFEQATYPDEDVVPLAA